MDIHQSSLYAQFMGLIGWQVEKIDETYIYVKKFPLIGATIKIQRNDKIPDLKKLLILKKKYRARNISIEPNIHVIPDLIRDPENKNLDSLRQLADHGNDKFFTPLNDPYLPTKTIHIDLAPSEQTIFSHFPKDKRWAIRRAEKEGIIVEKSNNIDAFIKLKNKTAGFLGFLTTTTLKSLWQTFSPKQAIILLAYQKLSSFWLVQNQTTISKKIRFWSRFAPQNDKPVAGILLLFHQTTAYYWIAAATSEGKKSFAPTLLVWEALKLAKKRGCTVFDFEGVFDERYPKSNKNWKGFTKFKSGFGGKEVEFPKPLNI